MSDHIKKRMKSAITAAVALGLVTTAAVASSKADANKDIPRLSNELPQTQIMSLKTIT